MPKSKKEIAIAPKPMGDRYKSQRTWEEFVIAMIPKDKYPTMYASYLDGKKLL